MVNLDAILGYMAKKKVDNPLTGKLRLAIGERVAGLRINREKREGKFSQNDLAIALKEIGQDVQQGQIGHIEAGRRLPSIELLYALAEYFETSLDYLTGRTKLASSIAVIDEDLQTGGISGRLGEIYKALPLDKQIEIFQFAEALRTIQQKDRPTPPPNDSQRRRANIVTILESIDRIMGRDVRIEIERMIRDKGFLGGIDDA